MTDVTPESQIVVVARALESEGYHVRVGTKYHANQCTVYGVPSVGRGRVLGIAKQYAHGLEVKGTPVQTYLVVGLFPPTEHEHIEPKPVTSGYE